MIAGTYLCPQIISTPQPDLSKYVSYSRNVSLVPSTSSLCVNNSTRCLSDGSSRPTFSMSLHVIIATVTSILICVIAVVSIISIFVVRKIRRFKQAHFPTSTNEAYGIPSENTTVSTSIQGSYAYPRQGSFRDLMEDLHRNVEQDIKLIKNLAYADGTYDSVRIEMSSTTMSAEEDIVIEKNKAYHHETTENDVGKANELCNQTYEYVAEPLQCDQIQD